MNQKTNKKLTLFNYLMNMLFRRYLIRNRNPIESPTYLYPIRFSGYSKNRKSKHPWIKYTPKLGRPKFIKQSFGTI